MTKILFIITGLNTGGAEMMLFKLLKGIDRKRFDPMVISLTSTGEIGAKISTLNISVVPLEINGILSSASVLIRLTRLIRRFKPHIVHTWLYHADLLGGLSARLAGVPVIIWGIRTSDLPPAKLATRVIRRLCGFLSYMIPDGILLNSKESVKIHQKLGYGKRKMRVIPNGFDLSHFAPDNKMRMAVRDELGIPADAIVVGMVGRFDPQKNYAGFSQAMKLLCKRLNNVYFILAGNEVTLENDPLRGWIMEADALSQCRLLGLRDDVPRLMTAMDVLALPSSYGEAFPNVLGEAMACGVPCVATDVGDSAYIVGCAGKVVPPGDMSGLAEVIMALVTAPPAERVRISELARARVLQLFDIRSVVANYENCYADLMQRKLRRSIW